MTDLPQHAFEPAVLAALERLAAERLPGDAEGHHAHALAIAGMLAAGGTKAEVAEYLRREADQDLAPVPARELTGDARRAWLLVRGLPDDDSADR